MARMISRRQSSLSRMSSGSNQPSLSFQRRHQSEVSHVILLSILVVATSGALLVAGDPTPTRNSGASQHQGTPKSKQGPAMNKHMANLVASKFLAKAAELRDGLKGLQDAWASGAALRGFSAAKPLRTERAPGRRVLQSCNGGYYYSVRSGDICGAVIRNLWCNSQKLFLHYNGFTCTSNALYPGRVLCRPSSC